MTALRGRKARLQYREYRKEAAVLRLQAFWRGTVVRRAYLHDRKRIITAQSAVRRKLARNQLKTLRVAAKSASHFKEVSYKLENKVVELTQTLQKRNAENREQQAKIKQLEESLLSWTVKFDEAEAKAKELVEVQKKSSVALPEFEALSRQKQQVDEKLQTSMKKIADQDSQIEKLLADFAKQTEAMEARQKVLNGATNHHSDDSAAIGTLRAELASLREQLSRAANLSSGKQSSSAQARDGPPNFNMALGRPGENGAGSALATPHKRRNRRGSVPQIYPSDSTQSTLPPYDEFAPRAFSVNGLPQDALRKLAGDQPLDPEAIAQEIIKLLEDEKPLDEDMLGSLIVNLRIPQASSSTPPVPKEVLFPAHLISLVTNEMWKYGMLRESERFLANVMQTIQSHVMVRCWI